MVYRTPRPDQGVILILPEGATSIVYTVCPVEFRTRIEPLVPVVTVPLGLNDINVSPPVFMVTSLAKSTQFCGRGLLTVSVQSVLFARLPLRRPYLLFAVSNATQYCKLVVIVLLRASLSIDAISRAARLYSAFCRICINGGTANATRIPMIPNTTTISSVVKPV